MAQKIKGTASVKPSPEWCARRENQPRVDEGRRILARAIGIGEVFYLKLVLKSKTETRTKKEAVKPLFYKIS